MKKQLKMIVITIVMTIMVTMGIMMFIESRFNVLEGYVTNEILQEARYKGCLVKYDGYELHITYNETDGNEVDVYSYPSQRKFKYLLTDLKDVKKIPEQK